MFGWINELYNFIVFPQFYSDDRDDFIEPVTKEAKKHKDKVDKKKGKPRYRIHLEYAKGIRIKLSTKEPAEVIVDGEREYERYNQEGRDFYYRAR